MGSWTSWILICLIALVGLDLCVILMFFLYKMFHWCTKRNSYETFTEDQVIRYEEMVAIQTKPVPVVDDDAVHRVTKTYNIMKDNNEKLISRDDFDVQMFFSEMSESKMADNNEGEKEPKAAISLSIHFNAPTNELTIVLNKGKNIYDGNTEQQQHIQVSAMLMPDGNILYSCRGIPPNPLFKHNYSFYVRPEQLKHSTVKFNVWKIDKYSRKTPYGEGILNMETVFSDNYEYSTSIWMEIQRKDELENETMNGELLTLIQYLPVIERINVKIMKGRGFHFEDFDKDVYVKVSAVENGKVVRNRKTGAAKKSPNPVFNEMTQFQLDSEMTLENMTLIISIYAHRSRGPHKRLIGRSYIGNGELSQPTGRQYWEQIIENPHKMVAKWQEIQ